MDVDKINERLELALKPAKPPTLEEALEQVSRRGVLRDRRTGCSRLGCCTLNTRRRRLSRRFNSRRRRGTSNPQLSFTVCVSVLQLNLLQLDVS